MGQIVFQATLGGQTALVGQNTASSYSLTLPLATDTLVGRGTTDTLSNKTLTSPVISSIVNTGTLTLPTSTDTLVGRATTDTLTNKTLTSPTITSPTITGGTSTATQNLTNVTGTLGTSYGGTGLSTYSLGQIFFGATSNFGQSSNLYWDNTNNRLGLGTSTPSYTLDIAPSSTNVISRVLASGSNSNAYSIYTSNNAINNPVTLYVGSLGSSVGALIGTYTNSDLVFGTNNQTNIMRFNTTGILSVPTLSLTNALSVSNGGTGLVSLTSGYIPYGNGTSAFSSSANLNFDGNNLGLGVTPSAWNASVKSFEQSAGNLSSYSTTQLWINQNAYYNSGGSYIYKNNGAATQYQQSGGVHYWFTAPSGTAGTAISFTQAMTLDNSGNLLVGTSSSSGKFTVNTGANTPIAFFNNTGASGTYNIISLNGSYSEGTNCGIEGGQSTDSNLYVQSGYVSSTIGNIIFRTGGASSYTERMRIDSSGNLLVGATSTSYSSPRCYVQSAANGLTGYTTANVGYTAAAYRVDNTNAYLSLFYYNTWASSVGTITTNGSSVAYNTTSDYRLKENVQPMTGALDTVAKLKPVTYDWIATKEKGQGFIAHELQAVVPDCVTGQKDAVDAEGKPIYQGVDTSFLVATLTAAIQELKAEFDAYKATHP